jgi:transposase
MSTDTKLPTLPQETATQLVALKGISPEEFYALVTALRTQGWPLRAIGEPFGVSRTAVQGWETKYSPETPLPEVPELPQKKKKSKEKKQKYVLTPEECQKMAELAETASSVRRYTDENAPSRKAAEEFERYLLEYTDLGVSRADLARASGVSDSSIKQRLRKY